MQNIYDLVILNAGIKERIAVGASSHSSKKLCVFMKAS